MYEIQNFSERVLLIHTISVERLLFPRLNYPVIQLPGYQIALILR
jgi:hypothetical protein